ncbi:MAG: glycoside hydrolase family 28 protein [Verrucomicrobiia bacterium]|jgi:polygalacturonase
MLRAQSDATTEAKSPAPVTATAPAVSSSSGADQSYNVRAFGALGDGKNLDSPAINRAIDACAQAGGGTVYVPPGTYLCGSIRVKSNIHLRIDAGATILGAPQEMNAYDPAEPFAGTAYQDGGHTYFHNSLIWGEDLTNVWITGLGMINGGGLTRSDKEVGKGPIGLGDKAIALRRCRNVLIRDITIFHGGHFAIIVLGCDNMTIDNVTIDTNRDGLDLDCCRNTTVSNCRINSPTDDGLCPKSSYGLGEARATENMTIVNCQVSGFEEGTLLDGRMLPSRLRTGRIKFGTESNGGFRNITVANCTFRQCRGLALEEVDGGILENIAIENITMMDVADYPIYIRLGRRNRGPAGTKVGTVRNVFISNVIATGIDAKSGVQILGLPGYDIEGVRLQNIRLQFNGGGTKEDAKRVPPELETGYPEPRRSGVMPTYGLFARHVRDLEIADFHVSYDKEDLRPPAAFNDVDGLEIDNFNAQMAKGVPAARFDGVDGLVIRNSPVLDGLTARRRQRSGTPAPEEKGD